MRTRCSRVLQDTLFDVGTQIFGQKYYRNQTNSVGSLLIRCVGSVFVNNMLLTNLNLWAWGLVPGRWGHEQCEPSAKGPHDNLVSVNHSTPFSKVLRAKDFFGGGGGGGGGGRRDYYKNYLFITTRSHIHSYSPECEMERYFGTIVEILGLMVGTECFDCVCMLTAQAEVHDALRNGMELMAAECLLTTDMFYMLGCTNSTVRDSRSWRCVMYSQGIYDCWSSQWTYWTSRKDCARKLSFQWPQVWCYSCSHIPPPCPLKKKTLTCSCSQYLWHEVN